MMTSVGTFTLLTLLCVSMNQGQIYVPELSQKSYERPGDLNLGILLPVHLNLAPDAGFCDESVRDIALLQRLEAVAYVIDEINRRDDLMPNHTLGFVMYDDCYTDVTALAQSLHFARTIPPETCDVTKGLLDDNHQSNQRFPSHPCENTSIVHHDVVGVIGSESSISTVHSANLLTAFQVPQLSYLATSPLLSSTKYGFFLRTVPSDEVQARLISSLIQYYNWTYVSVLYAEGEYGEEGIRVLKQEADQRDICFSEVRELRRDFTQEDYNALVYRLLLDNNVSVIVVWATQHEGEMLMEASRRMMVEGRLTWLASDAWARSMKELSPNPKEALGLISANLYSNNVDRFDDYFQSVSASSEGLNPWMDSFWIKHFDCTTEELTQRRTCDKDLRFSDHQDYYPDGIVGLVFDTVYAYAFALDSLLTGVCKMTSGNALFWCINNNIREAMSELEFMGETGEMVKFNEEGNRDISYDILNVQKDDGDGYVMKLLARYNSTMSELVVVPDAEMTWSQGKQPESACSHQCGVGEEQVIQQKKCCWVCVDCLVNQYTMLWYGNERCFTCPVGTWPDEESRTECLNIEPSYLTWSDPIGVIILVLASLGLLCCLIIIVIYLYNFQHSLIKACSRELSSLLMLGIILCYCFTYTFLLEPTDGVCLLNEFGAAISYTLTYSPLAVRTVRIYVIFSTSQKMQKVPRYMSSHWQVVISASITLIHAAIIIIWGLMDPPLAQEVMTAPGRLDIICTVPMDLFAFDMVFNGILILVCAVFAFKTRKLPDNYNESRFIGFCVFASLVILCAFLPAFFAVNDALLKDLFLCLMVISNASVILALLFAPRIYALYYVPDEGWHIASMLRRHKTSVVTPQPCPPITGEADPKPEPSAARISSHVYQSKGAPGGDCPPTPGVYSAMDYPQTPDGDGGDSPQ